LRIYLKKGKNVGDRDMMPYDCGKCLKTKA